MTDTILSINVFSLTLARDTPYLGSLQEGEEPNVQGYFVRTGNRTVYPVFDRSILVKIETKNGVVGWGETYGLVAPGAVAAIINDLLAGFTIGRDPADPEAIYNDLYDLVRVRGYTGGFYVDALAAIDIALWDIAGKQAGKNITKLLGGILHKTIPAYVSGLPESTIAQRTELALSWQARGFNDFKFATPVANQGAVEEIKALREALGSDAKIAVDMHWKYNSAEEALALIAEMEPYHIWFAEAPVQTEEIFALEKVSKASGTPIAVGEEWRTVFDMIHRIERCKVAIVQPEMGHVGITNFIRIGKLAAQNEIDLIPHATIGIGIFLAASLLASQVLRATTYHEFQHSVFEPNRHLLQGDMTCDSGKYYPPTGSGLGVEPSEEALRLLQPI